MTKRKKKGADQEVRPRYIPDGWVTTSFTAIQLGVSERTLRRWIHDPAMAKWRKDGVVRLYGNAWIFFEPAVEDWADSGLMLDYFVHPEGEKGHAPWRPS